MPIGDDICRVKALTVNPTFLDYYHQQGGDYNPEVGDWGFMYRTEAETARDASDVLICAEHTPQSLIYNVPRPLVFVTHIPADGAAVHIIYVQPGISSEAITLDVSIAVDGGPSQDLQVLVSIGDTSKAIAQAIAALVFTGVTSDVNPDNLNDVFFAADAGELTTFTVAAGGE